VYLNQPFSAPPLFNVQALISIAQAQVELCGDHLWLLQTEPAHTRRYAALVMAGDMAENLTKHNQKVISAV
jgi:hypothetical protein